MKPPIDETWHESETREEWISRVQRETTEWLDKHGDDPCEHCGMKPITQSHRVGCPAVVLNNSIE